MGADKIMKNKTKYIVKPEEKIVVSMLESVTQPNEEVRCCCSKATYEIVSGLNFYDTDILFIDRGNHFKSIARCSDSDIFCIEDGKKVSAMKSDIKYHQAMVRKYKSIKKLLMKAIEEIDCLENKHLENADKIIVEYNKTL